MQKCGACGLKGVQKTAVSFKTVRVRCKYCGAARFVADYDARNVNLEDIASELSEHDRPESLASTLVTQAGVFTTEYAELWFDKILRSNPHAFTPIPANKAKPVFMLGVFAGRRSGPIPDVP